MNDFDDLLKKALGIEQDGYYFHSSFLKRLENNLEDVNIEINNFLAETLGLEKRHNMYVEIYLKDGKEKKILTVKNTSWSEITQIIEEWVNDPIGCVFLNDIEYICVKADKIKYYQVNTIMKNLTKKVTFIRMKEKPKGE